MILSSMSNFSSYTPTWCPGCGNWGIGATIKTALHQLGYSPSSVAIVFGIGCSGNMNDFINAYAMHGLHGRAIPNAIGIKLANHSLPVLVIAGDGDCYGEGGNHIMHACRGNHDITVIVHDNGVYGLTTGQVSPRAHRGTKSKSTPMGIIEKPLNPLTLCLTQGATFIAQGFAGNIPQLITLIKAGINHRGFSLINVLQPCVTFNKVNTYDYYRDKTFIVSGTINREDYTSALELCSMQSREERFPLGILYQKHETPYHENISTIAKENLPLIKRNTFNELLSILSDYQ